MCFAADEFCCQCVMAADEFCPPMSFVAKHVAVGASLTCNLLPDLPDWRSIFCQAQLIGAQSSARPTSTGMLSYARHTSVDMQSSAGPTLVGTQSSGRTYFTTTLLTRRATEVKTS